MLVTFIPFQCPRKENKRKHKQKTCISKYLEPYFSAKSPSYLPTQQKNAIPSIVYVPCLFAFKIMFLFIVQLEAHGKVALYGGVHLCKLHVRHFIS
jgi:hypothetical protein